jgi:hypothetical protein
MDILAVLEEQKVAPSAYVWVNAQTRRTARCT